jgi:hypothetical protein
MDGMVTESEPLQGVEATPCLMIDVSKVERNVARLACGMGTARWKSSTSTHAGGCRE